MISIFSLFCCNSLISFLALVVLPLAVPYHQHLIKREGILLALDDGEAAAADAKKRIEEERKKAKEEGLPPPTAEAPSAVELRVLALNPNYVVE